MPKDGRSKVFVSYSHSDSEWLKRLQIHIRDLERRGLVDLCDDTKIRPGDDWRKEISDALGSAAVAVLLISADFIASDFVAENELPPLLAAAENEGVVILPLILSPSLFETIEDLSRFQSINPPSKPLIGLSKAEQEEYLVKLSKAILGAVKIPTKPPVETAQSEPKPIFNLSLHRNKLFTERDDRRSISLAEPEPQSTSSLSRSSPFVVGQPLSSGQPIFGRDDLLKQLGDDLAGYNSINLHGERRMGKTSVLNHLLGRLERAAVARQNGALLPVQLDLLANLTSQRRFYAAAIRALLATEAADRQPQVGALIGQFDGRTEIEYDDFREVLLLLRRSGLRPLIVVDEFELFLEPRHAEGFPRPEFFNGLRALIGNEDRPMMMMIASRLPLVEYFRDGNGLTSTFPNYLIPYAVGPLAETDADKLLCQPSDHRLTIDEVTQAKDWAIVKEGWHPCRLQAAGAAIYRIKANQPPSDTDKRMKQAYTVYQTLAGQNCFVSPDKQSASRPKRVGRGVAAVFGRIGQATLWFIKNKGEIVNVAVGVGVVATLVAVAILIKLGVLSADTLKKLIDAFIQKWSEKK